MRGPYRCFSRPDATTPDFEAATRHAEQGKELSDVGPDHGADAARMASMSHSRETPTITDIATQAVWKTNAIQMSRGNNDAASVRMELPMRLSACVRRVSVVPNLAVVR